MKFSNVIFIVSFIALIVIYAIIFKVSSKNLFRHIISSLFRMVIGYLLAVILGIFVAVLIGLNKYLIFTLRPILSFFMSIPTIAWVPLLLIITGIGEKTIIVAIFLGAFFPIVFSTLEGFAHINPSLLKLGKTLGYSNFEVLYKISIPASFNMMIVGLKLGIAYAWRALVGAEMLAATKYGLGFVIFTSRAFYNIHQMIVALAIIGMLGYLLSRLISDLIEENTLKKWGY